MISLTTKPKFVSVNAENEEIIDRFQSQANHINSMVNESISTEFWQVALASALTRIGIFSDYPENVKDNTDIPGLLHYTATCAILFDYLTRWDKDVSSEIIPIIMNLKSMLNYVAKYRYNQIEKFSSTSFLKTTSPLLDIITDGEVVKVGQRMTVEMENHASWSLLVDNKVILGSISKYETFKLLLAAGFLGLAAKVNEDNLESFSSALRFAFLGNQNNENLSSIVLAMCNGLLSQHDFVVVISGCYAIDAICSIEGDILKSWMSHFYWKLLHVVFPEFLDLPLQMKLSKNSCGADIIGIDPDCILMMDRILQPTESMYWELTLKQWQTAGYDLSSLKLTIELLKNCASCSYDFDGKPGRLNDMSKDKFIIQHLLKLWWSSSHHTERIQGVVAITDDLFTHFFFHNSSSSSPKKAKKGQVQNQGSSTIGKSTFPHAGAHCVGLLFTVILSVLPSCVIDAPIAANGDLLEKDDHTDGSPYHIFRMVCKLTIWIYHSMASIICEPNGGADVEVIASHSQLLIKASKGILEALNAKVVFCVNWRTTCSLSSPNEYNNASDPGSLRFLYDILHWTLAVTESLKRFQELYLNVFTVSDRAKNRWAILEDAIDQSIGKIEDQCAMNSLEVDLLHSSDLNRSCWSTSLLDELKLFMLSNMEASFVAPTSDHDDDDGMETDEQ